MRQEPVTLPRVIGQYDMVGICHTDCTKFTIENLLIQAIEVTFCISPLACLKKYFVIFLLRIA